MNYEFVMCISLKWHFKLLYSIFKIQLYYLSQFLTLINFKLKVDSKTSTLKNLKEKSEDL